MPEDLTPDTSGSKVVDVSGLIPNADTQRVKDAAELRGQMGQGLATYMDNATGQRHEAPQPPLGEGAITEVPKSAELTGQPESTLNGEVAIADAREAIMAATPDSVRPDVDAISPPEAPAAPAVTMPEAVEVPPVPEVGNQPSQAAAGPEITQTMGPVPTATTTEVTSDPTQDPAPDVAVEGPKPTGFGARLRGLFRRNS